MAYIKTLEETEVSGLFTEIIAAFCAAMYLKPTDGKKLSSINLKINKSHQAEDTVTILHSIASVSKLVLHS